MEIKSVIEQFIINYGLISIFIIVALEYANAPLPSEVVLPLIGILALKFDMNLVLVITASVMGGVVGSVINYYLGYKLGEPLLAFLKNKYPKTKKSIKASYRWITKYNKSSVMISRLIPIARTFISIVAGVTKMSVGNFILYSTIGISVWNIVLILIGYIVGDNMNLIVGIVKGYSNILAVGLVIIIIGYFIIKKRKNKKRIEEEKIESYN